MIACYHAVDPDWHDTPLSVAPSAFATQCAWLARKRRVIDLHDAVGSLNDGGRLRHGLAAITFDDGFTSVHRHALPVLRSLGLPATVFVVADTLFGEGRAVDWVDTPPAHRLTTLTLDEVREMMDGGVSFGSHTRTHPADLRTLDEHECERELRDSREMLEEALGRPVPLLAYPRGRHDAMVRRVAQRAGYANAVSLPEGPEETGPFAIPRVGVHHGNSSAVVRLKASRPYLSMRMGRAGRLHPTVARVLRQTDRRGG